MHVRAISSRAVAAVSRFPSRGSRNLCLSVEGDEADDEAEAAGSGGGEATQRHNTLLTIGREAGATGRRGERGRHAEVLGRLARALRCRQAGGMGSFREPRLAARRLDGHAPGYDAGQSKARTATGGGATPRTAHAALGYPDQWRGRGNPGSTWGRFKRREAGIG